MSEEITKTKKLVKKFEGNILTITEGITGDSFTFDFSALPAGIQANLGPFGLGHKLGDAAAGKSGQEAIDSINKVWDGLMKGDWSVRAPAAEKISKSSLKQNIDNLSAEEQEAARIMLAKLGVKI